MHGTVMIEYLLFQSAIYLITSVNVEHCGMSLSKQACPNYFANRGAIYVDLSFTLNILLVPKESVIYIC